MSGFAPGYRYASSATSAAGDVANDAVDSGNPIKIGGKASSSTPTSVASGDRVDAYFDTEGRLQVTIRGYDTSTDSNKSYEVNPVSSHHVSETLATLTNIATNTTGYLYLDMDGYRYFTMQCDTSGTTPTDTLTLTVEMTCQNDGTAAASCTYINITNDWFGAASFVDEDVVLERDVPIACKYVRLKYVTSNSGGGDADLTVYAKRMW